MPNGEITMHRTRDFTTEERNELIWRWNGRLKPARVLQLEQKLQEAEGIIGELADGLERNRKCWSSRECLCNPLSIGTRCNKCEAEFFSLELIAKAVAYASKKGE